MTVRSSAAPVLDASAMTLSALCLIHCLALPVLAVSLPVFGVWAEAEWVHKAFVVFAVLISGGLIIQSVVRRQTLTFAGLAVSGLAFLIAGAFVEAFHDHETLLTVIGALLLASAHVIRWRSRA